MPDAPLANRTFVVTGGAGFIGSHLTDRLLELDSRVIVLDDLSSGRAENLQIGHPLLEFRHQRVGRAWAQPLRRTVERADTVVHLASPVGVAQAHCDPIGTARRVLDSGRAVVDACRSTGTPVLFTSSSEVYGAGGQQPLLESDPPLLGTEPRWSYATAKLTIERLVTSLRSDDVIGWIVRLFNVVGARQRGESGHVVPSFCVAAARGQDLIVHGDGSARRTFLHVIDAVDALVAVLSTPSLAGTPVNIGGHDRLTVIELADLVIDRSASMSGRTFVDEADLFGPRFARVHDRVPDTTRLRSATAWTQKFTISDAIDDRIQEEHGVHRFAS
jgi:UDP-glucose 4-epimerase